METHDNKKMLIPMISGVLFMIFLVVGATYAYFTLNLQNNYTETHISSQIDDVGTVSLLPDVDEMSLSLTVDNMEQQTGNVAYYGTKNGTVMKESSEVLAKASVSGEGLFNCTYDLTMTASGTNNLYNIVQNMEGDKTGHVILTVNGVRYDFGEANLFPKTIKGSINGLTEGVTQDITAQIMVVNKASQDQNVLMGTDIEITFKMDNFKCNMTEMGSTGKYVMDTSPANISTDLVEGLYRFQGTKDEVTNNYICFGTNNKNACLNSSGTLFRIIGITPDGELKVVYNGTDVRTKWHNNVSENASWPTSLLSQALQAAEYDYDINYRNIISLKEWKYDDFGIEKFLELSSLIDAEKVKEEVIRVEKTFKNSFSAKVGLLSLADIWESCELNNGLDVNGWLIMERSGGIDEIEWLMVRAGEYNGGYLAGTIDFNGTVNIEPQSYNRIVRPVFYLKSDLNLSGTGTIDDPYIVNI